jgi:hypothetical protein
MDRQKMQEALAFSAELERGPPPPGSKNSCQWRTAAGKASDIAFAKAKHASKAKQMANDCWESAKAASIALASADLMATSAWAASQLAEQQAASAAQAAELLMIASNKAEEREYKARQEAEKLRVVEAAAELGRKMEEDKQIQAALLAEARFKHLNDALLVPGLVNLCCCYVDYVLNNYVFYQECMKVSPLYVAVKATEVTMEDALDFDSASEHSSEGYEEYWPWRLLAPDHVLTALSMLAICDQEAVPVVPVAPVVSPTPAGVPVMLGPVL